MPVEDEEEETRYHEAGTTIRKRLSDSVLRQPIRSLRLQESIIVNPDRSILEVVHLLQDENIGCAVICDAAGVLSGIFTERDLLRKVVGKKADLGQTKVSEVMVHDVEALTSDDTIGFALNKMAVGGFRHIPIVDSKRHPMGMLSVKEIVRYIVEFFPEDVLNLPPTPKHAIGRTPEGG